MKSSTKYILYARKSTDTEDKQVQSLDDQIAAMKALARKLGLRIVDTVRESKSAKSPFQRPLFDKMIADIREGKANGVLCYQLDRLSRNPAENGLLQQLLQDNVIEHIQTIDKSYKPEDNSLLFSIEAGMSNEYVRDLIRKVKRGSYSKAEKGWLPGRPAIGYLNDRENKTIITDPERFPVVRKLWDMALTETYTIAEITRIADEQLGLRQPLRKRSGGNPLSYSAVYALFHNPFYMGKLRYGGKIIDDAKHPAMVTEAEFEKVQAFIDPGYTTRPKDKSYAFVFRGMFNCGDCGFAVTTQRKIKRLADGSESVHIYCHCTGRRKGYRCSQKSVYTRESEFNEQVKHRLSRFTIDPSFYQLAIEALAEEDDEKVTQQRDVAENQHRTIKSKEDEINNLRRMLYRGQVDDKFFETEVKQLENELETLQSNRNRAEIESRDWRELANETFTFARYAAEDFESDDLEKKRVVLKKLGQNLTVLDGRIQFTPVKYLVPIEQAYPDLVKQMISVRTMPQQMKKASEEAVISNWYTRQDSNL